MASSDESVEVLIACIQKLLLIVEFGVENSKLLVEMSVGGGEGLFQALLSGLDDLIQVFVGWIGGFGRHGVQQ